MFRTLVKTGMLNVQDQEFAVRYFEVRTLRGLRRFSAEILLAPGDRIILADDAVLPDVGEKAGRLRSPPWASPAGGARDDRRLAEGAQRLASEWPPRCSRERVADQMTGEAGDARDPAATCAAAQHP
jgi:hypothetical protein